MKEKHPVPSKDSAPSTDFVSEFDPEFHLKKCRDCTFRVLDVDPTNLAFKGANHCRHSPSNLIFIAGIGPEGHPVAQPIGSHYPAITEELGACSRFRFHGGNVRRNIVKAIPNQNALNGQSRPS